MSSTGTGPPVGSTGGHPGPISVSSTQRANIPCVGQQRVHRFFGSHSRVGHTLETETHTAETHTQYRPNYTQHRRAEKQALQYMILAKVEPMCRAALSQLKLHAQMMG